MKIINSYNYINCRSIIASCYSLVILVIDEGVVILLFEFNTTLHYHRVKPHLNTFLAFNRNKLTATVNSQ